MRRKGIRLYLRLSNVGLWVLIGGALLLLSASTTKAQGAAPYPPSTYISDVVWDFNTLDKRAPGSDNWPMTWADDGHQYTSWGDGGGFGGTNSNGRVSLGFARVEGDWNNYQGYNVWGGENAENPAQFGGKSYGIISVDGVLYAWWGDGSGSQFVAETRLLRSTDHSKTWTQAPWSFTNDDLIFAGSFLNFGRDHSNDRGDGYVYSYFPRLTDVNASWGVQQPGKVDLARVPKAQVFDRQSYEFFAGFDGNGNPTWTLDISAKQPAFEDPNGVWVTGVTYNVPLGRYLLVTEHSPEREANLGIFEAPEPWGPWSTIEYYANWGDGQFTQGRGTLSHYISSKWISADGRDFTLAFTSDDSWNTVRGQFDVYGDLSAQQSGGLLTVSYSGGGGIPSWRIVLDRDDGANIVETHVPNEGPPLEEPGWWQPNFIPLTINNGQAPANYGGTKELFRGFTVPTFDILEQNSTRIVVNTGGTSPNSNFTHTRTYTFTRQGVHMVGEFETLVDVHHLGLWGGFDDALVTVPNNELPIRSQGSSNWSSLPPGDRDSAGQPLPAGVQYPIETRMDLVNHPGTSVHFFFDRPFDYMIANNVENLLFLAPPRKDRYANIMAIWDDLPIGTKQAYELRFLFAMDGAAVPLDSTPPSAPTGLTTTGATDSRIDLSWTVASDPETGVSSYKIHRDGGMVGTVTGTAFSDTGLTEGTSYTYEVSAVNGASIEGPKSLPALATTLADNTPPTIASVTATGAPNEVVVVYSEAVDQVTAADAANYSVDNGITVSSASLSADLRTVTLTTSDHSEGLTYTLTVNSVLDRASAPNTIASDTTASYVYVDALIVSILSVASGESYAVVDDGLVAGARVYIDRSYTFSVVPVLIDGRTYIKTANDDKSKTDDALLTFSVSRDVAVFVAYDARATSLPEWLSSWTDTGLILDNTDSDQGLYCADLSQGQVTLGGNMATGAAGAQSNYTIVVAPAGSCPSPTLYPRLPGMSAPVQDLDGDGRAEDVNGNGRVDFADVVGLFDNLDAPEVIDNPELFDFNGDGTVGAADVQLLFTMVVSE